MSPIEPSDDRLRREEGDSPRLPGNVPFFPADCLERYCDGTLSAEETAALERQLRDDPQALTVLRALHGDPFADRLERPRPRRRQAGVGERGAADGIVQSMNLIVPPIILDLSPPLHSSVGSFLFSYTAAALILGLAFLIGWTWKIHYDREVVQDVPRQAPGTAPPETPLVGRITGLADCQWSVVSGQWSVVSESEIRNPKSQISNHELLVPLGAKYNLRSGFMEITYDSGARVILQGPATYEVESKQGGFLSLGKLTARVERQSAVGSRQSAVSPQSESLPTAHYPLPTDRGSKGERTANLARSQKEREPTTSLAPRPSPLFSVCTPTAIVTDLGTEFGVEVERTGATRSHVFQGRIEVRAAGTGKGDGRARPLGSE